MSPHRGTRFRASTDFLDIRLRLEECRASQALLDSNRDTGEDKGVTEPRPTIPALLEHAVREFGKDTYLVSPTDRLTYEEADRRSAHVGRWLLHNGVGKGTRVGLFFTNGVEWVTWWLAVSRIGALAVPLSTMYRPAEIAKVIRLADIGWLIAPRTGAGHRCRRAVGGRIAGAIRPGGRSLRPARRAVPAKRRAHR